LNNKYRTKTIRILIMCEILLMVFLAYSISGAQTWNGIAFIRDGAMFTAGLIAGPLVLKEV
jgi:hypothetical protein